MDHALRELLGDKEGRAVLMRRHNAGVTLIELAIGLVILGLLLSVAMPSFQAWLQNVQIRNAAESILNGIQTARIEAMRTNHSVELEIRDGSGWTVMDRTTMPNATIQQRDHVDGSRNARVAMQPAGAGKVSFNGMGWVTDNADGSPAITQIDVTSSVMTGTQSRPLRIAVAPGGMVRMCDPALTAPDPRAC
jgi:type IV fimbrial biogenesis protein FimT